jgi:hypothetical protein
MQRGGACVRRVTLPQLVDDSVLLAMMGGGCGAARRGEAAVRDVADGVRKFQMGSVPDRGGRESPFCFRNANRFSFGETRRLVQALMI